MAAVSTTTDARLAPAAPRNRRASAATVPSMTLRSSNAMRHDAASTSAEEQRAEDEKEAGIGPRRERGSGIRPRPARRPAAPARPAARGHSASRRDDPPRPARPQADIGHRTRQRDTSATNGTASARRTRAERRRKTRLRRAASSRTNATANARTTTMPTMAPACPRRRRIIWLRNHTARHRLYTRATDAKSNWTASHCARLTQPPFLRRKERTSMTEHRHREPAIFAMSSTRTRSRNSSTAYSSKRIVAFVIDAILIVALMIPAALVVLVLGHRDARARLAAFPAAFRDRRAGLLRPDAGRPRLGDDRHAHAGHRNAHLERASGCSLYWRLCTRWSSGFPWAC